MENIIIKKLFIVVLVFFTNVFFASSVLASNASDSKSASLDCVIDIHDEDALDYHVPIDVQKHELMEKKFLPSEFRISYTDKISNPQAELILTYLGTFKQKCDKRSPFTAEDQKIFDKVMGVEQRTKWWLTNGQAAVITTALSPLIGFVSLSPHITSAQAIIAVSLAASFAGAVNSSLAFYATGTLPNEAARKAYDRQNKFDDIEKSYERLAHVWIDMHFSSKSTMHYKSIEIAHNIKDAIKTLQSTFKEKTGYAHGDAILCPIMEANQYILNQKRLGLSPSVKQYILLKELQGKKNIKSNGL